MSRVLVLPTLLAVACTWSFAATASAVYYEPTDSLTTLAALGLTSSTVAHATVIALGRNYDWVAAPCTADGVEWVAADGVSTSDGCWHSQPIMVEYQQDQAVNTYLPVYERTPDGVPSGTRVGMYVGTTVFDSVTDPAIGFGYQAGPGDITSAIQLEGDWRSSGTDVTEIYWQIFKTDGVSSRRPFFAQYDRTHQRATFWNFLIGNGTDDTGNHPRSYNVSWDNDSGQFGIAMFGVTPNRVSLYAISDADIAADQNRLRVYSATGQGSALSLTYNGQDAEGTVHPTMLLQTVADAQTDMLVQGATTASFFKPSVTQPSLAAYAAIQIGDGAALRSALWSSATAPSGSTGANGDWNLGEDGYLSYKTGGAWLSPVHFAPNLTLIGAPTSYTATLGTNTTNSLVLSPETADTTGRAGGLRIDGEGKAPMVQGIFSHGSPAARTAVASGDNLLALAGSGYDGTTYATRAQILMTADQNWTASSAYGTALNFQATAVGATAMTTVLSLHGNTHFATIGPAPAASSCGTSPTVGSGSTDAQGYFTQGTTATGCTVTFVSPYQTKPSCTVTSEAGLAFSYAVSTTAMTITNVGTLSGTTFHYQCEGNG
jgi:hypothetical protein